MNTQVNARRIGNPRRRRSAFTLIELLLVMVILVVLAAVVVPKFANRSVQAKVTAATTDIATLSSALDAFEIDMSRYPTSEEGLSALVNAPSDANGQWRGPYISKLPMDPWNRSYNYQNPGSHNPQGYDLYSYGIDGTESPDDLVNWDKGAQ